jgi:Rha family phage regulatory protein
MDNLVFLSENKNPITSSRIVAETFEKLHKNVLQSIENLDCSPEFNGLNFKLVEYQDAKGEFRKEYLITRDGFTFLAMGFTGMKAATFKEAYIAAFNAMEAELKRSLPSTYKEALLQLVAAEEEKEQLALQCDNLNTVLDNLLEWVSIIKVAQHNKVSETVFNWRFLKAKSQELGYQIKKAESPRYGFQNLYHIVVFKACYPQYRYDRKENNKQVAALR